MVNGKDAIRWALLVCALFPVLWPIYAQDSSEKTSRKIEFSLARLDEKIAKQTAEIERSPTSASPYFQRAVLLEKKQELVRAIKDYGEAIRLDPVPRYHLLRGQLWHEMGESKLAEQDFDEALLLISEIIRNDARLEPEFHQERAWAWYAKGHVANAIKYLDLAYANETDLPRSTILRMRGLAWWQLGDLDKAETDFDSALEIDPLRPASHCERGRLHVARGDHRRAIIEFNEAIRLDPKQPFIYTTRALAHLTLHEFEKAISDCSEAIKIFPLYAPAYRHRGCARLSLGQIDLALDDFNQAVQFTPSYARPVVRGRELSPIRGSCDRVYYYDFLPQLDRAGTWRMKGEWEKAIDDLKETLRMDPASSQAQNDLAWVQATCPDAKYRDGKSAIELARKACEATKWKKDDYIVTLAAAHAEVGEYDEAVKRMTQASEIDPKRDAATREQLLKLFKQSMPYRDSVKDK